jgi:hypothetical protein
MRFQKICLAIIYLLAFGTCDGKKSKQACFIVKPHPICINLEIADTPKKRERGLMFRKSLPKLQGMLFIFEKEDIHPFWMKNTLIPLDMIFIDRNLKVVGIIKHAKPNTLTPRIVKAPSKYVIEVRAGFAKKYKIKPKTLVLFKGIHQGGKK